MTAEASDDTTLPALVSFHDFDRAMRVYTLEEASGWKWAPDVLERQVDTLMDDLNQIRSLVYKITRQRKADEAAASGEAMHAPEDSSRGL